MTESFEEIVELGHIHGVPVYPCIGWGFWQHWAFLDDGAKEYRRREAWIEALRSEKTPYFVALNSWDGTMPSWRGAATNLWNANPDGIYVFNGFHRASIQAMERSATWKRWQIKRRYSASTGSPATPASKTCASWN